MPTYRNPDELRAARHYRLRGYRILGTNVWAGGYELDVIARRGRRLVFCEVKGKTGDGYGDPLEMVGEEKLRRLHRAAEAWLARVDLLLVMTGVIGMFVGIFELFRIKP